MVLKQHLKIQRYVFFGSLTCSSTAERIVGNTSWGSIYEKMFQQTNIYKNHRLGNTKVI